MASDPAAEALGVVSRHGSFRIKATSDSNGDSGYYPIRADRKSLVNEHTKTQSKRDRPMTDKSTIQSWPREQLESAFTQREVQL